MTDPPLTGKRILVTRAREQAGELTDSLKGLGADVLAFPTIEIVPPRSWEGLDRAIAQLASYDWIIFTSVNGVRFFLERLLAKTNTLSLPSSLKVCAIGPATARKLEEKGIHVDYMPSEYVAEAIVQGFEKIGVKGKRILLARVKKARDVLPKNLRSMGSVVDVVEAYRTVKPRGGSTRLKRILAGSQIDVVTFTSSSTVNHFMELLEKEDLRAPLRGIAIASIGPVTSQTVRQYGLEVSVQPADYTIPALAQAVVDYFTLPHVKGTDSGRGGIAVTTSDHVQLPVDVVLFDLGNVILPFSHFQIAEKLARYTSEPEHPGPKEIFAYLFDHERGFVNEYESGKVSTHEFFQSLRHHLGLSLSFEAFVPIWNEIFTENREVSEIILALKGKKRLGLISNTNPLHFEYALRTFPVLRAFDQSILSHEVGFKKPAVEIFQKAMDWASVPAEKIVLIDDMERHVTVARSLGIQGVHFVGAAHLRQALAPLLRT